MKKYHIGATFNYSNLNKPCPRFYFANWCHKTKRLACKDDLVVFLIPLFAFSCVQVEPSIMNQLILCVQNIHDLENNQSQWVLTPAENLGIVTTLEVFAAHLNLTEGNSYRSVTRALEVFVSGIGACLRDRMKSINFCWKICLSPFIVFIFGMWTVLCWTNITQDEAPAGNNRDHNSYEWRYKTR